MRFSLFFLISIILLTMILSHEFYWINNNVNYSIGHIASAFIKVPQSYFSTTPTSILGIFTAYTGSILMLLTLHFPLYKRFNFLAKKFKKRETHVNFHIYVGTIGPMLIIFHTNLHTGGIAGFAFWAMVITVASGFFIKYLTPTINKKFIDDNSPKLSATILKKISWTQDTIHLFLSIALYVFGTLHFVIAKVFMV